jgi:hypothetical protein
MTQRVIEGVFVHSRSDASKSWLISPEGRARRFVIYAKRTMVESFSTIAMLAVIFGAGSAIGVTRY